MPLSVRHRNALVTGASSGLGAAFCEMLLAEGVRVWGTARDPARLPARDGFFPLSLELADESSVAAAWAAAESASGGIDLLVNNAGAGVFGAVADVAAGSWPREMRILFLGPAQLARLAVAAMRARAAGTIVNVTSLAAEFPLPYLSGYSAGKAALAAWTAALGLELAGTGVTVLDFRPGDFRSNFNRAMESDKTFSKAGADGARVWNRYEQMLARAPGPRRAAGDLRAALRRGRGGVVRSGAFFQARLGPWLDRLAPAALSAWFQRRYFGLS